MLINYRRGAAEPRRIPLWHVLEKLDAAAVKSLFEGKVVIVGSMLDGDSDIGPTPLEPTSALVKAHAQATDTILRNAFVVLRRQLRHRDHRSGLDDSGRRADRPTGTDTGPADDGCSGRGLSGGGVLALLRTDAVGLANGHTRACGCFHLRG